MAKFTPPHERPALQCGEEGELMQKGCPPKPRALARGAGFAWLASICCAILLFRGPLPPAEGEEELPTPAPDEQRAVVLPAESPTPTSPAEIEQAIAALKPPFDQQQLSGLFAALNQIQDPQEQARLQQLLDTKVRSLLETPSPTAGVPGSTPSSSEVPSDAQQQPSEEDLRTHIDALNLGKTATADDLRARDQVVATIAGIKDPFLRERLLHHLLDREHQAEGEVPITPTPPEE